MKKPVLTSAIIVIALFIEVHGLAQFTGIPAHDEMPDHPRIVLLDSELEGIKVSVRTDSTWKKVNDAVLLFCDELAQKEPVERKLTGKRLLSVSRECLRRVLYLSYAWRMTQHDEYLFRAEREMLAAAKFEDWNPSHFLDVAEMTMALAIGYDWLFSSLSPSTRNIIKDAIIEKGLKPSTDKDYNWWLRSNHNWNQVCNAGMLFGALAVYDDFSELADSIINRSVTSVLLPMKNYEPNGNYPEGYGYWGYGTTFNILLIDAYEKVFGLTCDLSDYQGFMNTASYMLHMVGPTGECFNYSDNSSQTGINPAMYWFAGRLRNPSILWNERQLLEDHTHEYNRFLPFLLVWGVQVNLKNVVKPDTLCWFGHGETPVVLMRSSWDKERSVFIGIKGGSCQAGHAHMDMGSFIMESDGVRWAMDFGAQDYNSLESKGIDLWNKAQDSQRWRVFRYNNLVHNTLTVNNQFQQVDGFAPLIGYSADESFMAARFNLTDVYKDQLEDVTRSIALVQKQYVVIQDEVVAPDKETIVRWTLLTSAGVNIKKNGTVKLAKEGKSLKLIVQEPENAAISTWPTTSPNDYDAANPGTMLIGFETKIPAGARKILTVFLVPEGVPQRVVHESWSRIEHAGYDEYD